MKIINFILILLLVSFIIPNVQAGFWDWFLGDNSNLAGKAVYESDKEDYAEAFLKLGGKTYQVISSSDINLNDFSIKADINGDGSVSTYSIDIIGDESDKISKDTYFYLKDYGVMRYKGASKDTDDVQTMEFQDIKTGERVEIVYSKCDITNADSSLKLGGKTYKVISSSDINLNDFSIKADINGDGTIGTYSANIVNSESSKISKDSYFYLKGYGKMRYKGATKDTEDTQTMKFQDIKNGETLEIVYSKCDITNAESSLKLGGNTYKVVSTSDINSNDFSVKVDLDGDGTEDMTSNMIYTENSPSIWVNNYFYLKGYGVLKYKGATKDTDAVQTMEFNDIKNGETIEIAYTTCDITNAEATLSLGGNTYDIMSSSSIDSDDFSIKADINGDGTIGSYSADIVNSESDAISRNDYFYLKGYGKMKYRGAEKATSDVPIMRFSDYQTDETIEIIYTINGDLAEATLNLGGESYKVISASSTSMDDFDVKVDMDASNTIGDFSVISSESVSISKNEYFVLEDYGIVRYRGAEKQSDSNPLMRFSDSQTSETIELSYPVCSSANAEATLNLGGESYRVISTADTSNKDFAIKVDCDATGSIGDYDIQIVSAEYTNLNKDDYFYLYSYGGILQYKGSDKATSDSPVMRFKDMQTGETIEISYPVCSGTEAEATLKLGGENYKVISASSTSISDFDIKVDMDSSNTIGDFSVISSEDVSVSKNEYFVLEDYGILGYKGADKQTSDSPVMRFKDEQNGESIEISYPACPSSEVVATLKLVGESYKVISTSDTSSRDFDIKVDMDASGTIGNYDINIINSESESLNKDDYVFLKYYGLVRYKGADKATSDSPVMKFQDKQTGETIEITYKIISKEEVPSEEKPTEEPEQKPATCNGCLLDEKCIPYGTRIKNQYCDLDNTIKDQKPKEESCNNNYECASNICVNSNCIEGNFIQKIINWFRRLFGG